jgi:hypothetical protein
MKKMLVMSLVLISGFCYSQNTYKFNHVDITETIGDMENLVVCNDTRTTIFTTARTVEVTLNNNGKVITRRFKIIESEKNVEPDMVGRWYLIVDIEDDSELVMFIGTHKKHGFVIVMHQEPKLIIFLNR